MFVACRVSLFVGLVFSAFIGTGQMVGLFVPTEWSLELQRRVESAMLFATVWLVLKMDLGGN